MQTIACREADGVNVFEKGEESLKENISIINRKLRKFGRDSSKFEISLQNSVTLVKNEYEKDKIVDEIIKQTKDEKITKAKILENRLIGTTDDIRKKMKTLANGSMI